MLSCSIWTPLRHTRYRSLWIVNTLSNMGTWMQAMGAAWLMTSLSPSLIMTPAVQTATSLPVFLFAIIAGTLADLIDRPKFLFIVNGIMALAACLASALVFCGLMTPWLLLILTFMLGVGAAFIWPAWQASMSGLVDHTEIHAAATLNNLSYNLAAIIGPALGGLIIKLSGPAALFAFNAVSFSGLIIVYYHWWKTPHELTVSEERFSAALRAGFKAVRNAPIFHAILINCVAINFSASAFIALLPLIVREYLHLDSGYYGLFLGCLGLGSVLGVFCLQALRTLLGTKKLMIMASCIYALLLLALTMIQQVPLLMGLIVIGGIAWVAIVSSLNAAAQSSFPITLRARALSIYLIVLSGTIALGSYIWGLIASLYSIKAALMSAAILLLTYPLLSLKWPVQIRVLADE